MKQSLLKLLCGGPWGTGDVFDRHGDSYFVRDDLVTMERRHRHSLASTSSSDFSVSTDDDDDTDDSLEQVTCSNHLSSSNSSRENPDEDDLQQQRGGGGGSSGGRRNCRPSTPTGRREQHRRCKRKAGAARCRRHLLQALSGEGGGEVHPPSPPHALNVPRSYTSLRLHPLHHTPSTLSSTPSTLSSTSSTSSSPPSRTSSRATLRAGSEEHGSCSTLRSQRGDQGSTGRGDQQSRSPCSTLRSVMSSPHLLRRITRGQHSIKHLKVLVLGQTAVGKTALTVRFITRRFIGEYDPTLEQKYSLTTDVDGEQVSYEILDTAGQSEDDSTHMGLRLQENIRWADAYILVYSVTDRCSFNECTRMRFLINHCRRPRGHRATGSSHSSSTSVPNFPVLIVGNKNDLDRDRMVSYDEGQKLADDLGCARFHEISVRESFQEVRDLLEDTYFLYKASKKSGKTLSPPVLTRGSSLGGFGFSEDRSESDSDVTSSTPTSPRSPTDTTSAMSAAKRKASIPRRLMRRVFKQDSLFKQDSISESLKEDSSQDSS